MAERLVYQDNGAMHRVVRGGEAFFYDPQCDNEVAPEDEAEMDAMGPANYLQVLCMRTGKNISPVPPTEHECRRASRKIIRSLEHYKGEKYVQ